MILKPVTTYYISLDNSKDWYDFDGINEPKDLYTNPKKYPLFDIMHTAKAKIMFHPRDNLDLYICGLYRTCQTRFWRYR